MVKVEPEVGGYVTFNQREFIGDEPFIFGKRYKITQALRLAGVFVILDENGNRQIFSYSSFTGTNPELTFFPKNPDNISF